MCCVGTSGTQAHKHKRTSNGTEREMSGTQGEVQCSFRDSSQFHNSKKEKKK